MKKITKVIQEKMLLIIVMLLFTASVQAQSVAITGNTFGCQGIPTVLGVAVSGPLSPPYSYVWSNGATSANISITNFGFYRVTVTGTGANGNSQTVQSPIRIFFFLFQPNATITANGPVQICPGSSVTLTATGGNFFSTYLWNSGETTASISVSTSGTYFCTINQPSILGSPGCTSTSNSIIVDVIDAGFAPTVSANGPLTFCQPGSVTLTAQSGFTNYLWTNGATTQSTTVTLLGTTGPVLDTLSISCSVLFSGGCSKSSKTIVVRSIRQPELEAPFCPNYNLSLTDSIRGGIVLKYLGQSPAYEFEFEETTNPGATWTVNNGTTRLLALSNVTPALQVGKFYNVRERAVINNISYCYGNPCVIGISSPIFDPNQGGQKNSITGNIEIGVFPNPSNDMFNVNILTASTEATQVKLMDITGRVIEGMTLNNGEKTIQVGKNLNPGMYLIQVLQGSASSMTRVVRTN